MLNPGLSLALGTGLGVSRALAATFSPFLPSTDPNVLMDLDLRLGAPTGWTEYGTPVYDPVRGFVPNGSRSLKYGTFPHNAAMAAAGAIIIEVERSGLAYDDATRDAATFADLEGNTDTASNVSTLIWSGNDFSTERWIYYNISATANTLVWQDDRDVSGGAIQVPRVADKVPQWLDPDWATVILTWDGTTEWLIIDGLVIEANTTSSATARMATVTIGGRGNGTPSTMWRNGAIRRVQFVGQSLAPVVSATRIALIGDSFVVGMDNRAAVAGEPKVSTEAEIAALQTNLALDSGRTARLSAAFGNGYGGWWLQSLAYLYNRQRVWFPIYNAGDSGNGWRGDLGAPHQFGTGAQDAIAAWESGTGPDVIFAFGSVNDVNLSDTTHTLAADIESYLEAMAAKCTSLQKVVWFDTFFTPEAVATDNTAAYYAELAAQRAAFTTLNPTLVNGSAQPVEFVRVDTWPLWAPSGTQPVNYALGSHPDNGTATYRTTTVNGDVHPTSEGYKRIAEIVWPYLKSLALSAAIAIPLTVSTDRVVLAGTQPRDFHVRPSVVEVDATAATFNGTRIALADADRTNALTITGGTFVNLTTPHTQQGAWCIGPIRDQNLRDYGDITLDGCYFENITNQCFHAFGGGTAGFEAMTWGDLTFTDCVAKNIGGETFYVKGPQTGNITATGCDIGTLDTRTGWASDHTAFAGDGLDFSNAQAASWAASIIINGCTLTNLDGYGIVASSNDVTILNTTIEHCHDPASGATNVHSVLHDPYGPDSAFAMSGCTIRTAKTNGGIRFAGSAAVGTKTAVVSTTTFEVNGDHIEFANDPPRISLTEVSNTVGGFSGVDPKA